MDETSKGMRSDEAPFVGTLRDTGLASHKALREIAGVPGVFVRVSGAERSEFPDVVTVGDDETGGEKYVLVEKPKYSRSIHQKYLKGLALFRERSEHPYDVAYPEAGAVVARDPEDGETKVMLVTQKVTGAPVIDALRGSPNDKELGDKVSAWLNGSSQYLLDKHITGGDYLSDFTMWQYMYGTTENDAEPKIYDIDLDMQFRHSAGRDTPTTEVSMGISFLELARAVDEVGRISPDIDTTDVQSRIREFAATVTEDTQPTLYPFVQAMHNDFIWLSGQNELPS